MAGSTAMNQSSQARNHNSITKVVREYRSESGNGDARPRTPGLERRPQRICFAMPSQSRLAGGDVPLLLQQSTVA